ncbi:DUF2779 domain-containing protein [Candidatus Dependentiae bacterium]|nr:DUF2779 domain-containing protein [Candidatus Dependentiae bacterium]
MITKKYLTKTTFLKGAQCAKLLWYFCNDKAQLAENSNEQSAFDQGLMVGQYAKQMFPDGIEINWENGFDNGIAETQKFSNSCKALFEPGFVFGNGFARNDILAPVKSGKFDIIEVKSANAVKDIHIFDVAFQRYCCEGAGIKINKCFIMHINKNYERCGELDINNLFVKIDITKKVAEIMAEIEKMIMDFSTIMNQKKTPRIECGDHCFFPYHCPLYSKLCDEYAGKNYSIFQLRRAKKKAYEFIRDGIFELANIPASVELNKTHKIQVQTAQTCQPHIDKPALKKFLNKLEFPLYILDFETFSTAVPLFDKIKPYVQVTFQYSLHIVNELNSAPQHFEYLASGDGDPRIEIMESLYKLIGNKGSIMAYNMSFEKLRLKENAHAYPKFKNWVNSILPRFVDLFAPFNSFHYYHPAQKGSASVKAVLPALTGKSYSGLEISNGLFASNEYMRIAFTEVAEADKNKTRRNLLEYCKLDTEGLIHILRELETLTIT